MSMSWKPGWVSYPFRNVIPLNSSITEYSPNTIQEHHGKLQIPGIGPGRLLQYLQIVLG